MKRIIIALLIFISMLTLASCSLEGILPGGSSLGGDNEGSSFDPNNVTLLSVYNEAQALGFEGTLEEFIKMISGKDGTNGKDGVDGAPGADGKDGVDGKDGADGITPMLKIGDDNYWYASYDNGATWTSLGVKATGADGADGAPGTDGEDGKDGAPGVDGEDGKTPTFKIENGNLFISYDDGASWSDLGHIQGADGEDGTDGVPGQNGVDGAPGVDGEDGKSAYEIYKEKFGYEGTEEQWLYDLINGKLVTDYHQHTFGEWIDYGGTVNRLLYRICSSCNCIEWKNGGCVTCDFETVTTPPTCQAEGYDTNTCTVCGKVEITNKTAMVDHQWQTNYSYDNSFHWYKCEFCEEINNKAEHSADDSGYCTECDQPIGATVGVIYDLSADGTYAEVIGYSGTAARVLISDTYNGVPVTNICNEAFKNSEITSVVIPNTVTEIGESAFFSCSNLTSVVIGDGVTTIGVFAFNMCSSLASVTIEGSPNIGLSAFGLCNSALYTEYEFGKYISNAENPYAILVELTNINLSTYKINEFTKIIAHGAFRDCGRLTSITIPDSITTVSDYAFKGCSKLTSVDIGDNVTTIGSYAFCDCAGLTSVVIPDSVESIGNCAFSGCSNLASIFYGGTESDWNAISIENNNYYLLNATRYYYSEGRPTVSGNFWHYENGVITIWGPCHHTDANKDGVCDKCEDIVEYTRDSEYIYFGEYPQTIKESSVTVSNTQDARGYFLGSDGYYYAKVVASPCGSDYKFSNEWAVTSGTTYYFKVEPIRWRILTTEEDNALILCDSIIAKHGYDDSTNMEAFEYDYYNISDIRAWLCTTFYENAFTELQREIILTTTVDNSEYSAGYDSFDANDTEDKLFLLSYREVNNTDYGFIGSDLTDDTESRMQTSDYARATGAYMSTDSANYGNGCWWLRSHSDFPFTFKCIFEDGSIGAGCREGASMHVGTVCGKYFGVVPALWIKL